MKQEEIQPKIEYVICKFTTGHYFINSYRAALEGIEKLLLLSNKFKSNSLAEGQEDIIIQIRNLSDEILSFIEIDPVDFVDLVHLQIHLISKTIGEALGKKAAGLNEFKYTKKLYIKGIDETNSDIYKNLEEQTKQIVIAILGLRDDTNESTVINSINDLKNNLNVGQHSLEEFIKGFSEGNSFMPLDRLSQIIDNPDYINGSPSVENNTEYPLME